MVKLPSAADVQGIAPGRRLDPLRAPDLTAPGEALVGFGKSLGEFGASLRRKAEEEKKKKAEEEARKDPKKKREKKPDKEPEKGIRDSAIVQAVSRQSYMNVGAGSEVLGRFDAAVAEEEAGTQADVGRFLEQNDNDPLRVLPPQNLRSGGFPTAGPNPSDPVEQVRARFETLEKSGAELLEIAKPVMSPEAHALLTADMEMHLAEEERKGREQAEVARRVRATGMYIELRDRTVARLRQDPDALPRARGRIKMFLGTLTDLVDDEELAELEAQSEQMALINAVRGLVDQERFNDAAATVAEAQGNGILNEDDADVLTDRIATRKRQADEDVEIARKREQEERVNRARQIIEGGGTLDDVPPADLSQMDGETIEALDRWSRQIKNGEEPVTDSETYYRLSRMAVDDPQAFRKLNLLPFREKLDDEDWQRIVGVQSGGADVRTSHRAIVRMYDQARRGRVIDPKAEAASFRKIVQLLEAEGAEKPSQFSPFIDGELAQYGARGPDFAAGSGIQGEGDRGGSEVDAPLRAVEESERLRRAEVLSEGRYREANKEYLESELTGKYSGFGTKYQDAEFPDDMVGDFNASYARHFNATGDVAESRRLALGDVRGEWGGDPC